MGYAVRLLVAAGVVGVLTGALPVCAAEADKAATAPAATPPGFSRERAEDVCTQEPRSQWLSEAEMRLLAEHRGYKIVTFKIANGSCYEIYGFKSGNMVEAYFNPVTSKLVRQNIAK